MHFPMFYFFIYHWRGLSNDSSYVCVYVVYKLRQDTWQSLDYDCVPVTWLERIRSGLEDLKATRVASSGVTRKLKV